MKKDICNRVDIEQVINTFYSKVLDDDLLAVFFTEKVVINWDIHLSRMCDFWENMLLFTGNYQGNPMMLHQHLSNMHHLETAHFNRWLELFVLSVDQHFRGANARLAKKKAKNLSAIISKMIKQKV